MHSPDPEKVFHSPNDLMIVALTRKFLIVLRRFVDRLQVCSFARRHKYD